MMRRYSGGFPGLPAFIVVLIVALLLGVLVSREVRAEEKLTDFDFLLLGLGVRPEPEVQTVPRNTASGLFVRIELSSSILLGSLSVEPDLLLSLLPPGLEVRGELVGPGLEAGIQLRAAPGELLPIPPLSTRGLYVVRDIRLLLDGEPYLRASPDVATVEVIDRVLVTQVTTRPLTLEEIRQKGILFGDDSFTGYNFLLALRLDSRPVTIELPVVFDSNNVPVPLRPTGSVDISGPGLPALSAGLTPILMTPDVRGIDPEILAAIPSDLRIPGLLVIPGDIGFLNQFFSALLIVANGAPLGSSLSVHSLQGEILLPDGEDGVAGTSDDPLRLAVTEGGPPAGIKVAAIRGPGGDRFEPGEQGQAEYLLEGRREGFHEIRFDIMGSLDGLPVGTIPIRGEARGGILVRNRDFHLTFSVPATVRAQEEFTLYVTVTNTALDNAPLVRVGIGGAVSGASLIPGEADVRTIEDLAPRESETLPFRFVSTSTGQVTASYLRVEQGTGKLLFRLGVGERGVALSSDTLVLPSTVEALASPAEKSARRSPRVVQAALRVLGAGWSIATAPAGSVPADVTSVSRQTVLDRATAIGEAGFRVQLGENLERALIELAMDFLGDSDPGFFEIVHETDAGRDFLEATGATLREIPSLPAAVASLNLELAEDLSSRAKHLIVGASGTAPPGVELFGPTPGGFVPLEGGSGLVLVPTIEGSLYEVRFQATATGSFDLALNVPFVGGGTGVYVFEDVPVDAGTSGSVVLDLRRSPDRLRLDLGPAGVFESQSVRFVAPRGPKLLAATAIGPETLNGTDPWGRLVALLFDREVRAAEAEAVSSYEVEANAVLSARRQLSGRLVFLFLRDPVGNFIPREAEVEGLFDPRGMPMTPFLQRDVILSRLTEPGAIVSGRVLDASGNPVPTAEVLYLNGPGIGLSQKPVSPDGSYGFDYVQRSDRWSFAIRATDRASGAIQELSTRVTEDGEHIKVDLVLRGRGGVEGFVRSLLGEPRPGARVLATSQADLGSFAFAEANGDGFYRASGIVVGPVSVKAVDGTFSGVASGNVYRAGAFARVDVVLNESRGRVQGRVFELVEGVATAPLPDVEVYYVLFERDIVAASTRTDAAGAYFFDGMPTGGFRILALDRVTSRQATSPLHTLTASGLLEIDVFLEKEKVGTIQGTVSDAGGAVSGVVVQAAGRQVVTSPGFVLANVPVGTHTLSASLPGTNRAAYATVVVVEGETANVALRLSGTGQVVVRVLDSRGAAVAGQRVIRLTGSTACAGDALTTGADGTVTFDGVGVPGGTFKASRDGDIATGHAFLAREGEEALLTLRFAGFGAVFGVVSDESGPVFGSDVSLGSLRYDPTICEYVLDAKARQVRSDSLGRYRFEKVPVGPVSVTASAGTGTSLPATAKSVLLFDSDARELNLTLTDNLGGRLVGRVFLPDGTTPAGAGVRVSTTSPIGAEVAVVTKDDSSYELPKILAPGRYELSAHDPVSGRVARETVYLLVEQDLVADLRLLGMGTVVVTVRDGSGVLAQEAFVELEGAGFPFDERAGAIVATDGGKIRFDRVTEGSFTVSAASEGKGGRSTGSVSEEGSVANVTVHLTSVGRIVGVLKSPDGAAGVPNAEILVKQGGTGRLVGSTTTSSVPESVPLECRALLGNEALGLFTLVSVPAGSLLATATDPLTGRIGEASARIEADGNTACVEIRLLGLGTLAGFVESGAERVADAKVELTSSTGLSSIANLRAEATTDGAGAFRFEGVPVGSFTLRATVSGLLLTGTASGTIKEDGERLEDIEVALEASGSLEGAVMLADGTTPVAGALVTLRLSKGVLRAESTAGGSFAFDFVPAGDFSLTAEENGGFDGGILEGTLLPNEHLEGLVLNFRGTGTIEGTALDSDGIELSSGLVLLTTPPPFARSETATVSGSGSFRFLEVAVGAFELVLEVAGSPLRGIASGEVANDGDVVSVPIRLEAARPVFGRVVREDGTTPAPNVSVTLTILKSAGFPFQDLTDEAGGFRFSGVPLGAFTLRAEDALTGGVALATGSLDEPTPETGLDLGTLVLDQTPIEVSAVAPTAGATLVPPDSAVQITFSDPLETSGLVGLVTVTSSGASVPGSFETLPNGVTLRFTPVPFLPPRALVTVVVSGGVKDVFGRTLGEEFRSSFTTGGAIVTGTVLGGTRLEGIPVTLTAGGETRPTTTDPFARFRFEDVPVGGALIQASDAGLAASRAIDIGPGASVVTADLLLATVGSFQGQVFRHDQTLFQSAGLEVLVTQGAIPVFFTTTDASGRFQVSNIPTGAFTVDVTEPVTGDRGRTSDTLLPTDVDKNVSVTMIGVSRVRVFVTDSLGDPLPTASVTLQLTNRFGERTTLTNPTFEEVTKSFLFAFVLAEPFTVEAEEGGLRASGSGSAIADQEVEVHLALVPAGAISGRVLPPGGGNAVVGASVQLYRSDGNFVSARTTDGSGFLFESLPVADGPYRLDVFFQAVLLRARRTVLVPTNGVAVVDIEMVGLGTVTGTLVPPVDRTLSPSVPVTLTSFAPDLVQTLFTSAVGGIFQIANVPVGPFLVTARDSDLYGEVQSGIPAHGDEVAVSITLTANTVVFGPQGFTLRDGNDSQHRIFKDGELGSGTQGFFSSSTRASKLTVTVDGVDFPFAGDATGFQEDGGREVLTSAEDLGGLLVQRKIFVPVEGYFGRYLEIFENASSSPIAFSATLSSRLRGAFGPTQFHPRVIASSSGDTVADPADFWLLIDDAIDADPFVDTSNRSSTAWVLGRDGSEIADIDLLPGGAPLGIEGELLVRYRERTLAPGERVVLAHFVSQQLTRAAAAEARLRLHGLAPEVLLGLSLDELEDVVNFDALSGPGPIAPLPRLDGRIAGQALAHDGESRGVGAESGLGTVLTVFFQSQHVLFGRRHFAIADGAGRYQVNSSFTPSSSRAIPRFGFTLRTTAPTNVTAEAVGSFGAGAGETVRNLVFSGSSALDVTTVLSNGDPVRSTVEVRAGAIGLGLPATDGQGRVFFAPIPPGKTRVDLMAQVVGNSLLTQTQSVDLSPNVTSPVIITYPATTEVSGTVTVAGAPASGVPVTLSASGRSRIVTTDGAGRYAFTQVPGGTFNLRADILALSRFVERTIVVAPPSPSTENFEFPAFRTLALTVFIENPAGALRAHGASVEIRDALDAGFRSIGTTVNGERSIPNVAPGPFTLRIANPFSSLAQSLHEGDLPPGDSGIAFPFTVTIPAYGRIQGTVRFGDGQTAGNVPVDASGDGVTPRSTTTLSSGATRGTYTLTPIEALRTVTVTARHPSRNHIFASRTATITGQGLTFSGVDLTLPRTGSVLVRVERGDGSRVSGAEVAIRDNFSSEFRSEGTTSSGQRLIGTVPEGPFTVVADFKGRRVGEASGQITAHNQQVTAVITKAGVDIEGVVLAADDESPIAGASVELSREDGSFRFATTNGEGAFTIGGALLPGETGTLRATFGGEQEEKTVTATDESPLSARFVLSIPVVKGFVFESDGATVVPGLRVELWPEGSFTVVSTTADASGSFFFLQPPPGVFELYAEDSFGLAAYRRVSRPPDDLVELVTERDVLLPPFGSIAGTVTDVLGPRSAGSVLLWSPRLRSPISVFPDGSGSFRFDRVALGSFSLTYDEPSDSDVPVTPGFRAGRLDASGDQANGDIALSDLGSVFGQLLDASGNPTSPASPFAPLQIEGRGHESGSFGIYSRLGSLQPDGSYQVDDVPEGTLTATVLDDAEAGVAEANVTAGAPTPLDVRLGTALALPRSFSPPFGNIVGADPDGAVLFEDDSIFFRLAQASVNGRPFPLLASAHPDPSGEIAFGAVGTSGVLHTRKVLPLPGASFVRVVDVLENPNPFSVEVTLAWTGERGATTTSSGDPRLDTNDRYLLDEDFGFAVVFAGPGGRAPDAPRMNPFQHQLPWRNIGIPAGGRVLFLQFAVSTFTADAAFIAEELSSLDAGKLDHPALAGLSGGELSDVVNFRLKP